MSMSTPPASIPVIQMIQGVSIADRVAYKATFQAAQYNESSNPLFGVNLTMQLPDGRCFQVPLDSPPENVEMYRALLQSALSSKDNGLLEALLKMNQDPQLWVHSPTGQLTPLLFAAIQQGPALLQVVLRHTDLDLKIRDRDGHSALHYAIWDKRCEECAEMLIARNSGVILINCLNPARQTLIEEVVKSLDSEYPAPKWALGLLLRNGANVNVTIQSAEGSLFTAIMSCVVLGFLDMEALKDLFAHTLQLKGTEVAYLCHIKCTTPAGQKFEPGAFEKILLALKLRGASINEADVKFKIPLPLNSAVFAKNEALIQFLVTHGADPTAKCSAPRIPPNYDKRLLPRNWPDQTILHDKWTRSPIENAASTLCHEAFKVLLKASQVEAGRVEHKKMPARTDILCCILEGYDIRHNAPRAYKKLYGNLCTFKLREMLKLAFDSPALTEQKEFTSFAIPKVPCWNLIQGNFVCGGEGSMFILALFYGNDIAVEYFLERGTNPNQCCVVAKNIYAPQNLQELQPIYSRFTPLHAAATAGEWDICLKFLRQRVPVDATGKTPLDFALTNFQELFENLRAHGHTFEIPVLHREQHAVCSYLKTIKVLLVYGTSFPMSLLPSCLDISSFISQLKVNCESHPSVSEVKGALATKYPRLARETNHEIYQNLLEAMIIIFLHRLHPGILPRMLSNEDALKYQALSGLHVLWENHFFREIYDIHPDKKWLSEMVNNFKWVFHTTVVKEGNEVDNWSLVTLADNLGLTSLNSHRLELNKLPHYSHASNDGSNFGDFANAAPLIARHFGARVWLQLLNQKCPAEEGLIHYLKDKILSFLIPNLVFGDCVLEGGGFAAMKQPKVSFLTPKPSMCLGERDILSWFIECYLKDGGWPKAKAYANQFASNISKISFRNFREALNASKKYYKEGLVKRDAKTRSRRHEPIDDEMSSRKKNKTE